MESRTRSGAPARRSIASASPTRRARGLPRFPAASASAVAHRALFFSPVLTLLLADEPTGNLDASTGEGVSNLFRQLHREGMDAPDRHQEARVSMPRPASWCCEKASSEPTGRGDETENGGPGSSSGSRAGTWSASWARWRWRGRRALGTGCLVFSSRSGTGLQGVVNEVFPVQHPRSRGGGPQSPWEVPSRRAEDRRARCEAAPPSAASQRISEDASPIPAVSRYNGLFSAEKPHGPGVVATGFDAG